MVMDGPTQERGAVTEQDLVHRRNVDLNVEILLRAVGGVVKGGDAEDKVMIAVVRAGPNMFMTADEEFRERAAALELLIEEARTEGVQPVDVAELIGLVVTSHFQAFRGALSRDPQAEVEPLRVHVPADVRSAGARPRPMSRETAEWLHDHFLKLAPAGMVFANP